MAPDVERKTKVQELRLVRLNLTDGKPFDVKAFDEAVFWLNDSPSDDGMHFITHFVIADDIMYVFQPPNLDTTTLNLDKFNDMYPEIPLPRLQAYGAIELEYGGKGNVSRMIVPCSIPDMPETGPYSLAQSSHYMRGRFKELIGYSADKHPFTIAC